jgi:hypothetical protein
LRARPEGVRFYLDEGLAHQVGEALALVGKEGVKDPQLIPWLAEQGYVWITKDDEAKREHRDEIVKARISIVWVRGLGRKRVTSAKKNTIRTRDLFLILAVTLPKIEKELLTARGPRHYLVWMAGERPTHAPLEALERTNIRGRRRRRTG